MARIEDVVILNYKSLKEVGLSCKTLNLLVGEPNTGKSNILEALGLFTLYNNDCKITELVRMQTMHNLFYDNEVINPIQIRTNTHRLKLQLRDHFEVLVEALVGSSIKSYELYYDANGKLLNSNPHYTSPVNLYRFKPDNQFTNKNTDHLRPPFGDNLVSMLMKFPEERREAGRIYQPFGYRFVINPQDMTISIQKEADGIVFGHPYTLASHLLQRYVFHRMAIGSNKNAVIIFEEPESYSDSDFTQKIGHCIAENEGNNQYFISTHNPAFLSAMYTQMDPKDIKVYYTYYEDYQTKVRPINDLDASKVEGKTMHEIYSMAAQAEPEIKIAEN